MNARFYMQAGEYGYYNIYDRTRRNQWGERWCEACYLSRKDAEMLLKDLNGKGE
jgi:hypothetical protein